MTVSPETTKALLQKIHIFAGLEGETMDELVRLCRPVEIQPGQLIVREKLMSREMYVIATGRVRVVRDDDTSEPITLAELGPGEFFGEMSLIECVPRCASVYAVDPGVVYLLSSGCIHQLFKKWPDQCAIMILNIARDLCRRLRRMDEKVAAMEHSAAKN